MRAPSAFSGPLGRLGPFVLALPLLVTGCSSVSVSSERYMGAPSFAPSSSASVEILRREPRAPHVRLGEVVLRPSGSPEVAELERALREETAKLGGAAAVLVYDKTKRMGAYTTGPWWARTTTPVYGRVIVAVAIRYKAR